DLNPPTSNSPTPPASQTCGIGGMAELNTSPHTASAELARPKTLQLSQRLQPRELADLRTCELANLRTCELANLRLLQPLR
ncbi:hypothetical protein, partial [Rappaport israeli]|uniref:hypothetical protein n=1 Tax=Rappaport israeli TaxID=1839807 RepID=UPI001E45FCB9